MSRRVVQTAPDIGLRLQMTPLVAPQAEAVEQAEAVWWGIGDPQRWRAFYDFGEWTAAPAQVPLLDIWWTGYSGAVRIARLRGVGEAGVGWEGSVDGVSWHATEPYYGLRYYQPGAEGPPNDYVGLTVFAAGPLCWVHLRFSERGDFADRLGDWPPFDLYVRAVRDGAPIASPLVLRCS
jgi:hypothetical protein